MYLPNKIIDVLSKTSESYIAEYQNGKILSIEIPKSNTKIGISNKGYYMLINNEEINLDSLQNLEILLNKIKLKESKEKNLKKLYNIKDDLVELFSKQKKNFCVEYKNGKVVCIEKKSKNLKIKKNSVGYTLSINNKIIAIDNISSLKTFLQKMNILTIDKAKSKKEKNKEGFEQLMLEI